MYFHHAAREDLVEKALGDSYWYRHESRKSTAEDDWEKVDGPQSDMKDPKTSPEKVSASSTGTAHEKEVYRTDFQNAFRHGDNKTADNKTKVPPAEPSKIWDELIYQAAQLGIPLEPSKIRDELIYRAAQLGLPLDQTFISNQELEMILATLETEEGRGKPRRRSQEPENPA